MKAILFSIFIVLVAILIIPNVIDDSYATRAVTTDKEKYDENDSLVIITGSGFNNGQRVSMKVLHSNGNLINILFGNADSNGDFEKNLKIKDWFYKQITPQSAKFSMINGTYTIEIDRVPPILIFIGDIDVEKEKRKIKEQAEIEQEKRKQIQLEEEREQAEIDKIDIVELEPTKTSS